MDEDEDYVSSNGKMYCRRHRREVCQVCCVDHRITNKITEAQQAGREADIDALMQWHDDVQRAEMDAMLRRRAAEGGTGPLVLGSEEAQRLYEAVAAPPAQRACAHCGMRGDRLQMCSRCKVTYYCGVDHQRQHFPQHKAECKRIAAAAAGGAAAGEAGGAGSRKQLISWEQLRALQGAAAEGKVLELRVLTQPMPFGRSNFQGKDHKGSVGHVAFYNSGKPPAGLRQGRVLRWHNPRFHFFLDGSWGARIEEEDMHNLSMDD